MIIDGKIIAEEIVSSLAVEYKKLSRQPVLGILIVGHSTATESFVRIKTQIGERLGVRMVHVFLEAEATTEVAVAEVKRLSKEWDGVIVQLPLPKKLNIDEVLSAIPVGKDVDALNPTIPYDKQKMHAPVACAVGEILRRYRVDVRCKNAVVIGVGRLVGAPCISLLRSLGANVSIVTRGEGSLDLLLNADIIVSGTGVPALIKPNMIKTGVALIDAGASEQSGKLVGDADPLCGEKCAVFTPVPRGVGPIAIAMIYRNLFTILK